MKIELKQLKNYRIYILLSIVIFIAVLFFGKYRFKMYKENDERLVNETLNKINLKTELFITSINDLKNTEAIGIYHDSEEVSNYTLLRSFKEIKNKNNIYGKMGYTLSLGREDSNVLITKNGTRKKDNYYKELNLDSQLNKNFQIFANKSSIHLLLKSKVFNEDDRAFWVVTLDKDIFFSELQNNVYGKWDIKKDDKIYSLNSNEIFGESNEDGKLLNSYGLDFKFRYIPNYNYFYHQVFLQSILLIMFLLGLFLILNYSHTLHKERKKLLTEVNSLGRVDRRKNLRDLVLGIRKFNEVKEVTRKIRSFKNKNLKIVLVEIYDGNDEEINFKNFIMAREYLRESLSTNGEYEHIDVDYKSIAFIIPEETDSDLQESFSYILENISQKYSVELIAGISDSFTSLNRLSYHYILCKKILDTKFMAKGKRVLFSNSIKDGKSILIYPIETEAKLVSKLLNRNLQGAKKIVDEIFIDKENLSKMDKKSIRELSGLLYNTLDRVVIQLRQFQCLDEEEILEIEKISKITDLDELKTEFLKCIGDLCKQKKDDEQDENTLIKTKIEDYINGNYQIDFSLDNLADHLGLSFKYTSILFKKIMGDNFKNYINLYRIEKAKEILLTEDDIKIKDLAEKVGYNSSNTFIRIFKKYEGISPTQFVSKDKILDNFNESI